MATRRTQAELQAFFAAGQPAGAITPDRVQDAILTLRPAYARLSVTTAAETNITAQNTWTKLAGTTALGAGAFGFSMPQNNRLVCNVEQQCITTVTAAVSLEDGANVNFEVGIYKNGALMPESVQSVRIPTGGGKVDAVILADFVSEQNDFFEVWVRNTSNDANVTAAQMVMRVEAFVL